jgi:hypothetical protein
MKYLQNGAPRSGNWLATENAAARVRLVVGFGKAASHDNRHTRTYATVNTAAYEFLQLALS